MKRILLLMAIIAASSILSSGFDRFPSNEISKHIAIKTASEDSLIIVREFWNNPDYIRMEFREDAEKKEEQKEQQVPTLSYCNRSWLAFISSQAIGSWKEGYSSYAIQFIDK